MITHYADRALNSYPVTDVFVMMRKGNFVLTNVPHLVTHHSPTGFEFGYGGSGPADLALNILLSVVRELNIEGDETIDTWDGNEIPKIVWDLHQDFKWAFLTCDSSRIEIPKTDVMVWIFAQVFSRND